MAGFWQRRKARKAGKEWLRHARLCRGMREDIAPVSEVERLRAAEAVLAVAVKAGDPDGIERACAAVRDGIASVAPARSWPGVRENLEVVVVALAVAMAFRTYFLQPFKIPTGSMQPTLYGIHYVPQAGKTVFDAMPLKWVKWSLFGRWYVEFAAEASGVVRGPLAEQGGLWVYDIGGLPHKIPKDASLRVKGGDEVVAGQILATGNRITGDHLFVNRLRWNFLPPRRGEIMVFKTDGIARLEPKTHYIKRLVGLPNETVGIDAPYLTIDGRRVEEPASISRVEQRGHGYDGYLPAGAGADYIGTSNQSVHLDPKQFFGMGDNTMNSFDSRYWGPVPATNMVGPAWLVYWPISRRWGLVD